MAWRDVAALACRSLAIVVVFTCLHALFQRFVLSRVFGPTAFKSDDELRALANSMQL